MQTVSALSQAKIGALTERVVIQQNVHTTFSVSSLTRSGTTATATTSAAHGYTSTEYVTIAGAVETAYNGKVKVTVTGGTTFTYSVSGSPATPATGTITALYASDAQGGRRGGWTTLATEWAESVPMRWLERIQVRAVTTNQEYRFRLRYKPTVTPQMRLQWTPSWDYDAVQKNLEIHGVVVDRNPQFMILECGEVL